MTQYSWAVVGAGPAGILTVGKLLDCGVSPEDIFWCDPSFGVGDIGRYWYSVPSNTKLKHFTAFFEGVDAFAFNQFPGKEALMALDGEQTCLLSDIVYPLQWVTDLLTVQVAVRRDTVERLSKGDGLWHCHFEQEDIAAKKVVLATGAVPKQLSQDEKVISLEVVLNPELLRQEISPGDVVAVFGASHSGVLAIRNIVETGAKVTNIYRHPLRYAIYHEDHIQYDNTGLKGLAAEWAKRYLEEDIHPYVARYPEEVVEASDVIDRSDKVVYTIGFNTRDLKGVDVTQYDPLTGVIAANLFGIGIGFPEQVTDRYGEQEWSVGLLKFLSYINRVMPEWVSS